MRVISKTRLIEFWSAPRRADAKAPLERWYAIAKDAAWRNPADVKAAFGVNVDFVQVKSGETVVVIDVGGNKYRLIAAIHYLPAHFSKGRVYVLRIMDHHDYDRKRWIQEF